MNKAGSLRNIRYLKKRKSGSGDIPISKSQVCLDSKRGANYAILAKYMEQTSTKEQSQIDLNRYSSNKKLKKLPVLAKSLIEIEREKKNRRQKVVPYIDSREDSWKEVISKKLRLEEAKKRRYKAKGKSWKSVRNYKVIFISYLRRNKNFGLSFL